jgi:pyridinium-3,5-biscarboxylic acid mononucleotide sulfurtransferase
MNIQDKLEKLKSILNNLGNVVIAYSGGVDSTFLLKVAVDILGKENVKAILAISPTFPSREYDKALETAARIGINVNVIQTKEIDDPKFSNNPSDRCYFCKNELFTRIAEKIKSEQFSNIIDGSNVDDLNDYRPGRKALQEKNIRSPLLEAGLSKKDIRELSKELGLQTWNKDAVACLSSRFPYGESIDLKKLKMVDAAENYLSDLGFTQIRARHEKNSIRIEISSSEINRIDDNSIRMSIVSKMKAIGYHYVSIDLEGYRQGSQNIDINE